MATLIERLSAAEVALDREDTAGALTELIEAWQHLHCSRIAALVERVSAVAGAKRPAITAKTVKARLAAWLEVEKTHDLVDVERLLADPWPTQWRDGNDRFDRLTAWTPDPRVAAFLTRAFIDPPYRSQASMGLQLSMLRHLFALEDPRSREVVDARLTAYARNYHSLRITREHWPEFLAKLERSEQLEPPVEARIAALEARFASVVRTESETKKTAAEFLEAIHADPEEVAHKTVFADWLTENGHLRGELMTLQLARTGTKEATRRERALIEKLADDHDAWDWPIALWFTAASRRYEDGFFAGGHFELTRGQPDLGAEPGWSHVRVIDLHMPEPYGDRSFDYLARLPRLRELTNIGAHCVPPLLDEGAFGRLEVLEVVEYPRDGRPALDAIHPLTTTTKLPALKALGVACAGWQESSVETLPTWPIVRRVERLMLRGTEGRVDVQKIVADLATVPGPKTIEVRPGRNAELHDADVIVRLERTEPVGPFRRIAVRGSYREIAAVLDSFPEASFDFIALDWKRATLRPSEQAHLRAAVDRFPSATVEPPFETPIQAKPTREIVAVLSLKMDDAKLHLPDQIGQVMRHVANLGITFDFYSFGYGNQQRALKPDPIKKAEAMTKADKSITLYADGTESELSLGYSGHDRFTLELERPQLDGILDWVIALLEDRAERVGRVTIDIAPRPHEGERARAWFEPEERETINPFGLWLHASAYAVMLDEEWTNRLPPPRWAKHLPSEPSLAGLFLRRIGKNTTRLLVGLHTDPLIAPTLEEHQAFARVVHRMVADLMEETLGYRWVALAEEILGPMRVELGLDQTTKRDVHRVAIDYGNADRRRRFAVSVQKPFGPAPELVMRLECSPSGFGYYTRELVRGPAATRAEAASLLERAAAMALAERAWFENPAPPPKKKRR